MQDDSAHPHCATIVEKYHDRHLDYTLLEWLPYIPDLNPIEHSWDILGRAIAKVTSIPTSKEELLQIQ